MAGINDNDILDRIIENLTFDKNKLMSDSKSDVTFSKIIFGDPPNNKKLSESGNIAFVKTAEKTLVNTVRLGTEKGGRKRNFETRAYEIVIITGASNVIATSIRTVNTLTFKTKEVIEKNRFLTKPDGTSPLATDLEIFDVPRDVSTIGKDRQSNTIILRYTFPVE